MTTTIELGEADSALVFTGEGVKVFLPRLESEEHITTEVVTLCAIALGISEDSEHIHALIEDYMTKVKPSKNGESACKVVSAASGTAV